MSNFKRRAKKSGGSFGDLDKLSTRSRNILNQLGGTNGAIRYFLKNGEFLSFSGCGFKSNLELSALVSRLIARKAKESQEAVVQKENILVDAEIIREYQDLKMELSNRARNVLSQMEKHGVYDENIDNQTDFVTQIILGERRFLEFKNCGIKTQIELDDFFEVITSLAFQRRVDNSLQANDESENVEY